VGKAVKIVVVDHSPYCTEVKMHRAFAPCHLCLYDVVLKHKDNFTH
jgi:hypothetical protein